MVVVSHLFLFLRNKFRGRHDSCESCLPLFRTVYFPTAPSLRSFMPFMGFLYVSRCPAVFVDIIKSILNAEL